MAQRHEHNECDEEGRAHRAAQLEEPQIRYRSEENDETRPTHHAALGGNMCQLARAVNE